MAIGFPLCTKSQSSNHGVKDMTKKLTKSKAKKILKHGEVHDKPLTEKQKKFFGAVASGKTPKIKRKKKRRKKND